jgi:hypothetical protein
LAKGTVIELEESEAGPEKLNILSRFGHAWFRENGAAHPEHRFTLVSKSEVSCAKIKIKLR